MKRGTPRHPKTLDLMVRLDQRPRSLAAVVGYLELLFHFTAEFSPQGDIGKFSTDRIEAALDWHGKPGKLLEALKESGWLDECTPSDPLGYDETHVSRLVVHDYHDHSEDSVRKKLSRSGLQFLSLSAKMTGHRQTWVDPTAACLALPMPLPEPTPTPPRPAKPPQSAATQTEWPLTRAELARHDPATDVAFLMRLVHKTSQDLISAGDMEPFDDEDMASAIKESYRGYNGKRQHGNGLLLNRVPAIMLNWSKQNEQKTS